MQRLRNIFAHFISKLDREKIETAYNDYYKAKNLRIIHLVNKYFPPIVILINLIFGFYTDPRFFNQAYPQLLIARLIFITAFSVALCFVYCYKDSIKIADKLGFIIITLQMMLVAEILILLHGYRLETATTSWLAMLIISIMYPVSTLYSASAIIISLLYYIGIGYFFYNRHIYNEQIVQVLWQTMFVFAAVIILKMTGVRVIKNQVILQKTLEDQNQEITLLNEKLRVLDAARTDFFSNVSHELRTPLTLILAPVDEALKGRELDTASLKMIQRNARNLLSLINNLLDVSRMDAGRMMLRVSKRDLCEIIKRCCAEVESAACIKNITINCNVPSVPMEAYIDTERILHVMSNLFSNSFKFTGPGGRIEVSLESSDNSSVIKFSDTGCGIPENKINTIFDRFTQAESCTSRRYEGTGIGLAIVKSLVELHGGTVSARSSVAGEGQNMTPDHGTVFTITIPFGKEHLAGRSDVVFADETQKNIIPWPDNDDGKIMPHVRGIDLPQDENNTEVQATPGDEGTPVILVVEDNADLRSLVSGMLSDSYVVYTASNGKEALEMLEKVEETDIVLSDIMMPEMDGHELLACMRGDEKWSTIPFVFLTARADDFMKLEGLDLGAIDYITKPFNSEELLLRIRNQMEQKRLRNIVTRNYNRLMEMLRGMNRKVYPRENLPVEASPSVQQENSRMEQVCRFIHEHYTEDITRDDLASAVELNPDTFSRQFNRYTGVTLTEYIYGLRMDDAMKRLTETDLTVTRISLDTGFDSIRTFNRAFKKITGMSPVEFRAGHKLTE